MLLPIDNYWLRGDPNYSKPLISEAILEAANERIKRTEIDADWVLQEQVRVYERCMQDKPVLDKEGKETGEYKFDASGAPTKHWKILVNT